MPLRASIDVDPRQAAKLIAAINRDSKNFSGSLRQSITWGGIKVAESLGAATPANRKKRKIVENPDADKDWRLPQFGVWWLRQDAPKKFVPIAGSGQFEKIRFKSRTSGEILVRDRGTGKVSRLTTEYKSDKDALGVMKSPKRKIGRQGFAKRSWRFLKIRARRGGPIYINGIRNMGEVILAGGKDNPSITVNNRVSYMVKILKGGSSAVGNAMESAAKGMMHQMDQGLRKKMRAK